MQTSLVKALNVDSSDCQFVIYQDLKDRLEYIRSVKELTTKGFFLELKAYQHHTFLEFRTVDDPEGKWQVVYDDLAGKGYWSVQARFEEIHSRSGKGKK